MDARARQALEDLARQAVAADLDGIANEVAALRRDVAAVRQASGLPAPGELDRIARRERAVALRAGGHSLRSIAAALGTDRGTIARDLAEMGAPRPSMIRGLDGRTTAGPRAART
jgi:hypothetical protein